MPTSTKRILGIDPGLANTGYGIISLRGQDATMIEYGTIRTSSRSSFSQRLGEISDRLHHLLSRHHPDIAAIEELFFSKNAKTALLVGQAKGVIISACNQSHIPVLQFTPLQIKIAMTGYGRADKRQIQLMVKNLLKLPEIPRPDHAADALAVALCCTQHEYQKLHEQ